MEHGFLKVLWALCVSFYRSVLQPSDREHSLLPYLGLPCTCNSEHQYPLVIHVWRFRRSITRQYPCVVSSLWRWKVRGYQGWFRICFSVVYTSDLIGAILSIICWGSLLSCFLSEHKNWNKVIISLLCVNARLCLSHWGGNLGWAWSRRGCWGDIETEVKGGKNDWKKNEYAYWGFTWCVLLAKYYRGDRTKEAEMSDRCIRVQKREM